MLAEPTPEQGLLSMLVAPILVFLARILAASIGILRIIFASGD